MELCSLCNTQLPADSSFCPRCGTPAAAGLADELLASAGSDPTGFLDRLRTATAGEFTIIRELGRGGMGRVYLAHEIALDRRVAMKVLPPALAEHATVVRRFQREARMAGKLSHPYIVPVYQVSERSGVHFFTMPYVAGPSLRQLLRQTPQLSVEVGRRYLREASDALAYAHAQGVIHRDIKPENMLFEGSRDGRLLLTDFGIAKALGSATTLTRPGDLMGTPYFMSPEQCEEREGIDGRSDQYSLGLVGYEMLAGRFPFTADSLAGIVYKHMHEYPEPLATIRPDIPADLLGVIERAIRKDPNERFANMGDMLEALGVPTVKSVALASPAAGRTRVASRQGGAGRRSGRRRRFLTSGLLVVLAVALGYVVWQGRWPSADGNDALLAELDVPIPAVMDPADEAEAADSLQTGAGADAAADQSESGTAEPPAPERPATTDPRTPQTNEPEALGAYRAQVAVARGEAESARDAARRAGADTIFAQRFEELNARFGGAHSQVLDGQLVRAAMAYGSVRQDFDELRRQAVSHIQQAAKGAEPEVDSGDAGKAEADSPAAADSGATGRPDSLAVPVDPGPAAIPSEQAIGVLLDSYQRALEAEDLSRLSQEVYRGPIPNDDERLFNSWFDPAEDLSVALEVEKLEIAETAGTAEARVKQNMEFRLRRTGERRNPALNLRLFFARIDSEWRLARLDWR